MMKISNLLTILTLVTPAAAAAAVDRKRIRKVYTANKTSRALQPDQQGGMNPGEAVPAPASMSMSMSMPGTIYDLGVANPDFSTLVMLVDAAGLSDVLSGAGPFTLFAPTNEAFDAALAAMPDGFLDQLLAPENVSQLQSILTYHLLDGAVYSTDATSGDFTTVEGEPITVKVGKDGITINDANVVTGDIAASNGVIHVLDKVLVPSAFTLDDAATTVAAPTTIGIVPIDETVSSMSMGMSMSMPAGSGDTIYDLGVANPDFSTLVMLVDAAGLSDVLKGAGPFTLFAPTNEAFDAALAAMPDGFLDQLLAPENVSQLQSILTYHLLDGAVYSTDATSGNFTTVEGEPITVTVDKGGVMINDANVVTGDIAASNGVIHVIDKVLVPAAFTLDDTATTVAAPTTVAEGVTTTAAASTTTAVEGTVTTTPAVETTAAATETTVVSATTTVADETTVGSTTTAPLETVSPTAAPAPKSSAMTVGTTLVAIVVSCGAIAITV